MPLDAWDTSGSPTTSWDVAGNPAGWWDKDACPFPGAVPPPPPPPPPPPHPEGRRKFRHVGGGGGWKYYDIVDDDVFSEEDRAKLWTLFQSQAPANLAARARAPNTSGQPPDADKFFIVEKTVYTSGAKETIVVVDPNPNTIVVTQPITTLQKVLLAMSWAFVLAAGIAIGSRLTKEAPPKQVTPKKDTYSEKRVRLPKKGR